MKLKELLMDLYEGDLRQKFASINIQAISSNSKTVAKNSLFVALKGATYDGADFIDDAIKEGACVIVLDDSCDDNFKDKGVCVLKTKDPKNFLLEISQRFYGQPSDKIKTIGITGTNGKTTITYLLESILESAQKKSAVIGTINYRVGQEIKPAGNTTPSLVENQQFLADMVKADVEYCIMEVSSHALAQGRVDAINFNSAVFTNLTQDHLDYHLDMEDYFKAKAQLFTALSSGASAIINVDDPYGRRLPSLTKAKVLTYGLREGSDVTAQDIHLSLKGSSFVLLTPQGQRSIQTKLIGMHNICNILAAAAESTSQSIDLNTIAHGVEKLTTVPGRLEQVNCGQDYHVFVDYAHTDDALQNVLAGLKEISETRIILVFGCGGDRDKSKRPKMGQVADELADFTILTNDNPRSEEPQLIVDQIKKGFKKPDYEVALDREQAIKRALTMAAANDVVLIAGKGHEDYQIFKDKTIHFNDREVIRRLIKC